MNNDTHPELCQACKPLVESSKLEWVKVGEMSVGLHRQPLQWVLRDKYSSDMMNKNAQYSQQLAAKARELTAARDCSALVDALAEVLSHHALACVSGLNLHDKPWLFDVDANDNPLITRESCKCSTNSKYLRAILPADHPKGFSRNTPAQDNNNNQTN